MITKKEALEIHAILVEQFGGAIGIRDIKLLESAINRPYQTFDGNELYPTAIEKSAAIIESIVKNHPFIDGNKRTGYVLGRLLLMNERIDFSASQEERYEFIIHVSKGKLDFDQIRDWIQANTQSYIR